MALTKTEQRTIEMVVARLQALITPVLDDPDSPCHLGGIGLGNKEQDKQIKDGVRLYVQSWILPHLVALLVGDPERINSEFGRIDSAALRKMLLIAMDENTPDWVKDKVRQGHGPLTRDDGSEFTPGRHLPWYTPA